MSGLSRIAFACACVLLAGCTQRAEVGSDPPSDAGVLCASTAGLSLYYWAARTEDTTKLIDFLIKIENGSGVAIPLSTLSARYYFRDELTPPVTLEVYYSDTCCSDKITFDDRVLTSVHAISAAQADSYFEIGFDPSVGELAAGDAVQVELGYQDAAFSATSTQSNDYSFLATAVGTQLEWDACPGPACLPSFTNCRLTVHQAGARVWGTPP